MSTNKRPVVAGVAISNPDRVVYPELGLTKLDLAKHFAAVGKRMLPYVRNRPLSLLRCPDGIAGSCFFQKHWQGRLPDTLDTVQVREKDGSSPYVVVSDVAGIVTLAQWGTFEVHPWPAQADRLDRPDRITFDLDPGPGLAWRDVVRAARDVRAVLDRLGLVPWVKTTGGKGLHVVVPIARHSDWDIVSTFARAIAEYLAARDPDRYVSVADKSRRKGRIFVDWLRNTRGATAVAAWSPRAREAAGVSVPITWDQLSRVRSGDHYTIVSLPDGDAWRGFTRSARRITSQVIDRLGELS